MSRRTHLGLFAFWLFLIALLAWMWFEPDGRVKNSTWRPVQPIEVSFLQQKPLLDDPPQLATTALIAVTERPLFSKTRRPPPPPPPPPPTVATPVAPDIFSSAKLKGVINYVGGGGVVMEVSGKSRRIRVNESIDGWTLKSIDARSATFISGSGQRVVSLVRSSAANFSGVPPASPPPLPPLQPASAPASSQAAQAIAPVIQPALQAAPSAPVAPSGALPAVPKKSPWGP